MSTVPAVTYRPELDIPKRKPGAILNISGTLQEGETRTLISFQLVGGQQYMLTPEELEILKADPGYKALKDRGVYAMEKVAQTPVAPEAPAAGDTGKAGGQ